MSNPKLLARLREYGRGDNVENYLTTEYRQNLKQIREAFLALDRGPMKFYSSLATAAFSSALTEIQGFKVSSTFEARPIVLEFEAVTTGEAFFYYTSGSNTSKMTIQLLRTNLISGEQSFLSSQSFRTGAASGQARCGPGSFRWVDQPGPGQFEYALLGFYDGSATNGGVQNCKLVAYQPR